MNKDSVNYYKTCRETVGIRQEDAALALNVSCRSLSDYENGKTKVPDDIVDSMAKLYKSPLLAWWHLKNNSVLGKYLPDVSVLQSDVDMVFQGILSVDKLSPTVDGLKSIMSDGEIDEKEEKLLDSYENEIEDVNDKLISMLFHIRERRKTKKESRLK